MPWTKRTSTWTKVVYSQFGSRSLAAHSKPDTTLRGNALLFHGSPIANLPTARLFAYATHFEVHPLGLEWVDDQSCVFVFNAKSDARAAYRLLQKQLTEEPDSEGFITAKPIPVAIWPPEERINNSLGTGEGLKGTIRMRWARPDDVKKRGAKKESKFYRKHGTLAGKEHYDDSPVQAPPAAKRRRRGSSAEEDRDRERAALDAELDAFIRADDAPEPEPEPEPELELELAPETAPVSKMRSDYIAPDGRTLLERTSVMRMRPDTLESRLTAPLPRRARGTMYADILEDTGRGETVLEWGRDERDTQWGREREPRRNGRSGDSRRDGGRRTGRGGERRSRNERPVMTREDLDAELEAFLEDKDH
ncbi:hypothetical protein GGX14DRAFT_345249 [Mycena pura]|uniref:Chromatin target of PRMT1 protein C-terminal domain-containing protein n=1 Tax=Mycena pura TaxID=153505 RepID=A0AAD7E570_9AGAR|nr:hypothetical protein GGX14DRAFT_345249 [Mycena pura]